MCCQYTNMVQTKQPSWATSIARRNHVGVKKALQQSDDEAELLGVVEVFNGEVVEMVITLVIHWGVNKALYFITIMVSTICSITTTTITPITTTNETSWDLYTDICGVQLVVVVESW